MLKFCLPHPQRKRRVCARSPPFYMSQIARREIAVSRSVSVDYNPDCRHCPRLAGFLDEVREANAGYFCRPVPPFGDPAARLVIVGLAPGMHGANASGRPFTGDYAGVLLYATLFKFGYATAPTSTAVNDGLRLIDARITNAVKCLPPANKPLPAEIRQCNGYLAVELARLPRGAAVLALGRIAHDATLSACNVPARDYPFAHGAEHVLPDGVHLFDSYHCSRYNTNTRRLTKAMFEAVFVAIERYRAKSMTKAAAPAA